MSASSFHRAGRADLERLSLGPRDKRRMALLVLNGQRGFAPEPARAVALLDEASRGGDSPAALILGDMYMRGRGLPKNAATSNAYYRRAAELGNAAAQANVGAALLETNPAEAARFFELAAAQGQPYARTMLNNLRGVRPAVPTPSLGDFANMSLEEMASGAPPADGNEREIQLACTGHPTAIVEAFRIWFEVLDAAWPLSTARVELEGESFDFPFEPIPSDVMQEYKTLAIGIRPRGGDTVFELELSYDERFEVTVRTSEPHPDPQTWAWFMTQLDGSLRRAGAVVATVT